jgi:hypothetical protein
VDECYVYWANDEAYTVVRRSKTGGPVTALAVGQMHPQGIAVDAQNVYWVTSGGTGASNGTVVKSAK